MTVTDLDTTALPTPSVPARPARARSARPILRSAAAGAGRIRVRVVHVPPSVLEAIMSLLVVGSMTAVGSAWIDTAGGSWFGSLETPRWASGAPALLGGGFTAVCGLSALALWLVVRQRERRPGVWSAIGAWVVQAAVVLTWAWLLFNSHSPDRALAAVLVLIVSSTLTAVAFGRVSRLAGVVMLPALAWTLAVTALTAGVVVVDSAGTLPVPR